MAQVEVNLNSCKFYLDGKEIGKVIKSSSYGLLIFVEKSSQYRGGFKKFYGASKDALIKNYKNNSKIYKSLNK